MRGSAQKGFTLVEVMLAAALLGIGMVVLLFGLSRCLAAIRVSRRLQDVQWVLGLGEAAYPLRGRAGETTADFVTYFTVAPDSTLVDGYVFEREIEEYDEAEEGLFLVRTRVGWGTASYEEVTRYVWRP